MVTTSVDEYVGLKLKIRRSAMGITQHELGDMVGVTFQQIQKYEKGANRVGAGRLYEFATILNVPVSYFFDGFNGKNIQHVLSDNKIVYDIDENYKSNVPDKEMITLIKFYSRIQDKKTKNGIVNLTKSLSREKSGE